MPEADVGVSSVANVTPIPSATVGVQSTAVISSNQQGQAEADVSVQSTVSVDTGYLATGRYRY